MPWILMNHCSWNTGSIWFNLQKEKDWVCRKQLLQFGAAPDLQVEMNYWMLGNGILIGSCLISLVISALVILGQAWLKLETHVILARWMFRWCSSNETLQASIPLQADCVVIRQCFQVCLQLSEVVSLHICDEYSDTSLKSLQSLFKVSWKSLPLTLLYTFLSFLSSTFAHFFTSRNVARNVVLLRFTAPPEAQAFATRPWRPWRNAVAPNRAEKTVTVVQCVARRAQCTLTIDIIDIYWYLLIL